MRAVAVDPVEDLVPTGHYSRINIPMDRRHQQVGNLFARARRLPPADLPAFLDEACAGDDELRREVESLLAVHHDQASLLDPDGVRQRLGAVAADVIDRELPERIGPYRIVRLIGEGGMGVVYEAQQDEPRRRVALKVIRPGMITSSLLKRFRHETQFLGQLRHPGIAQIYHAGTQDTGQGSQPFFAMELVTGRPLKAYADEHRLGIRQRLELIAMVCDAVHHAHQKGIVHRDLKPANILVERPSEPHGGDASGADLGQPKILDFGVARATDADIHAVTLQTDAGQLVGTLQYMSPEQAAGDPASIDIRSDLYAIGVIAYELLSGRLPYAVEGKLIHEAVRIIREDNPSRLSSIDRALRGDVDTIIAKTLAKEKERRYQSAAELAADIRRYLNDQPIIARPTSAIYQLRKFARRNKVLVGAVTVIFATMLGATMFSLVQARIAIDARKTADLEKQIALQQARRATIAAATAALDAHDPASARQLLAAVTDADRTWELSYVTARLDQSMAMIDYPSVVGAGLSADNSEVVMVSRDGFLRRWNPFLGESTAIIPLNGGEVATAVFSLDATRVACVVGQHQRHVSLWEISGQTPRRIALHELDGPVVGLDVSADGRRVAVTTHDNAVVFDGDAVIARWRHSLDARMIAMSADGGRIAILTEVDGLGSFRVFEAASGAAVNTAGFGRDIVCLALSPDGKLVAAGELDRTIRIRDTSTARVLDRMRGHGDLPTALAFSPDGDRIVSAAADGIVRFWNTGSVEPFAVLGGHTGRIGTLCFSADGSRVLSAADDGTLRLWSTAAPDATDVLPGHASAVHSVAFGTSDTQLVSASVRGELRFWDAGAGECYDAIHLVNDDHSAMAVSPDGKLLAIGHRGGALLCDFAMARARPLGGRLGDVIAVVFAPDGSQLAGLDSDGQVIVWDAATADPVKTMHGEASPGGGAVSFSADGRRLASTHGTSVRIWDAVGGAVLRTLGGTDAVVRALAFAPGADLLATGWSDGSIRVFDPETGELVADLAGHVDVVWSLSFSPDGTRLVSGAGDATIWLWDAGTARPMARLRGHLRAVTSVAFSPSGSRIVSGSVDGSVGIWDTEPVRTRWAARFRAQRQRELARPLVDRLFELTAEPQRVTALVRQDSDLDEPLRMAALQLAMTPATPPNGVGCDPFPGAALEFDGADSHVLLGASDDLRVADAFTIEYWMQRLAMPVSAAEQPDRQQVGSRWLRGWQTILNKEGEYQVACDADGALYWMITAHAGWEPWISLRYAAPVGQWLHLAIVRERPVVHVYINGRLVQTHHAATATGSDDHHTDMDELRIGGRQHTPLGFRGRIDEVRLWRVARTAEQIAASMTRSLDGDEPGLIGYWRFDEGRGSVAHSLTGVHDGDVVGATWRATTRCDD